MTNQPKDPKPTPGKWTVHEWPGDNRAWSIDSKDYKGFIIIYDLDDVDNEANAIQVAQSPDVLAERDRLKEINAELVEALKFYANFRSWGSNGKRSHIFEYIAGHDYEEFKKEKLLKAGVPAFYFREQDELIFYSGRRARQAIANATGGQDVKD